jgi:hypothetical protein
MPPPPGILGKGVFHADFDQKVVYCPHENPSYGSDNDIELGSHVWYQAEACDV